MFLFTAIRFQPHKLEFAVHTVGRASVCRIAPLRTNVPKYLREIPVRMFRKWDQSTIYWEEAHRAGHTIETAEKQVRKYKQHCSCANVKLLGAGWQKCCCCCC